MKKFTNKYRTKQLILKKRLYYNNKRVKGPTLQERDYIYLFSQNLHSKQFNKKLNFKKYRLFQIKKKVVTFNYELNLPINIKVQIKVFYILLLELTLKGVPLKKKIKINTDKDKYDVKEVINSQRGKDTFEYLIKQLNYSPESNL